MVVATMQDYPKEQRALIARCARERREYGWEVVKLCVDQDLEAEAALAQYPGERAKVIAACRDDTKNKSAVLVKQCVDEGGGNR